MPVDFERSVYSHEAPAAAPGSLFETYADKVLRRVYDVLDGQHCPWPLPIQSAHFLRLLFGHQGKGRAISLGGLCERMKITPRRCKEIVQELRQDFGLQIGASREGDAGGYYLIATAAESVESTEAMYGQAISMLRTVHRMRGESHNVELLLTQISLDLTQPSPKENAHG